MDKTALIGGILLFDGMFSIAYGEGDQLKNSLRIVRMGLGSLLIFL